ncbi:holo-ACP synthase [Marinobacterium sediminicola]|uniref:Holo-[acyl-carrier-protein] synthase n=1 Tax=Marinobacterium sediminicola TaxID=518898 RepID=A0ABY1RZT1_9GAMM|nr:holo-ACP synthase [Marinobacterium sediminicola]ULG69922.1 holo-ACP synthase [Marinobacterium sediminicola]SMR74371.1 holo-[acyl-carrier protein] synthase [Marinobacterium sediminicola]
MIVGIGTDLLEIARMERALARTPRLPERILTQAELTAFREHARPALFLAKRFAAKEAAVKALGTGIGRGISWQHFEISHDPLGRPLLSVKDEAASRAAAAGIHRWHLSYTDERAYVSAFVIAEGG